MWFGKHSGSSSRIIPGEPGRDAWRRGDGSQAFHVLSFSDEVGFRKPDARIFRRTPEEAGCEPAVAVHVGDDPVNDVTGARAVGMRALHYVPDGRPTGAADGVVRHLGDLPDLLARLG